MPDCIWTSLAVQTPNSVLDPELSQLLRSPCPLWMIEEEEQTNRQVNENDLDVPDNQQDLCGFDEIGHGEVNDAMAMPWTDRNEDEWMLDLLDLEGTIEPLGPAMSSSENGGLPCSCSMNLQALDRPAQLEPAGVTGRPSLERVACAHAETDAGTMEQGAGAAAGDDAGHAAAPMLACHGEQAVGGSRAPRGAKRGRDPTADGGVAVAPKRGRGNRGAHVRERPDMQQAARDGAAHWLQRVAGVRAEWEQAAAQSGCGFREQFSGQVAAAHGRVKAKLECLLRTLHLAAHAGLIAPVWDPAGPAGGFFGWAGFHVAPGRAAEFRAAVEGLFPAGFREETVRETFRRAGLVPAHWRWEQGWRGEARFVPVVRDAPRP